MEITGKRKTGPSTSVGEKPKEMRLRWMFTMLVEGVKKAGANI